MNLEPELEQIQKFFAQFVAETDRGAALAAGAILEDRLGDILMAFLADDKESKKILKGPQAPLGGLSARISTCLALGLIDGAEFDEMNRIRAIRNKFAHNWDGVTFEELSIQTLTRLLPWRGPDEYEERANTKDRFCTAVSMLLVDLVWRTRLIRKEKRTIKTWPNRSR